MTEEQTIRLQPGAGHRARVSPEQGRGLVSAVLFEEGEPGEVEYFLFVEDAAAAPPPPDGVTNLSTDAPLARALVGLWPGESAEFNVLGESFSVKLIDIEESSARAPKFVGSDPSRG